MDQGSSTLLFIQLRLTPLRPSMDRFWYRSDTDRLHLRANGVTETIADLSDITGGARCGCYIIERGDHRVCHRTGHRHLPRDRRRLMRNLAPVDSTDDLPRRDQIIDKYVWSYDSYDAAAAVAPQVAGASGELFAVGVGCATANVGGETWAIEKNGSDTTEEVTLAAAALSEYDTTGFSTTVVAGDRISINPESSPGTPSENGSVTLFFKRT